MWIKTTKEGLTRAEAVRGVPEEVQKQLEKLKVGHVLCQLPPHLIADLLPYSGKFLRVLIFAVFMDQLRSAKLKPPNFPHGSTQLLHTQIEL